MTLTIILLLILLGILLMLAEIFVIPGVGVVGIIGFVLMAVGVYLSYSFGTTTGHITLAATAVVSTGLLVIAFQSKTWDRLAVKSQLTGKVNVLDAEQVKVGDVGLTVSRLAPMGKVKINDHYVEAKSFSTFIDESTPVEVVKVERSKIIVKIKTT